MAAQSVKYVSHSAIECDREERQAHRDFELRPGAATVLDAGSGSGGAIARLVGAHYSPRRWQGSI
jgi:hypothetical protein